MRRILYGILIFILVSCAEASKKEAAVSFDTSENEKTIELFEETTEDFTYQNLSKLKLQEVYDLLLLQKNHPEFNEDIVLQLKELSEKNIAIPQTATNVLIKSIKQLGASQIISDSITKLVLQYELDVDGRTKIDTINAIITNKQVEINKEKFVTTKLTFIEN